MKGKQGAPDAWYTAEGKDNDVILSSRIRVSRNLSGFVFPAAIKSDDAESVLSIIFDFFNHSAKPELFQMVRMSDIDLSGRRILAERGVIAPGAGNDPWRGIVIRSDGILSATVNMEDHLRLSAFSPGLSLYSCNSEVESIDAAMQKNIQFSAISGFGYLSSSLMDTGTGLRASILACLPGLCMSGLLDRVIREYLAQGFSVRGYYGSDEGSSLGCLYQISNSSASSGDSMTQIAMMEQAATKLADLERKSRHDLLSSMPVTVEDTVFRAIVTAKYARLIPLREAVELIQRIKLGVNLGLITGLAHCELTALLYRIQTAHIAFVISGGSVIIEEDVRTEETRTDRLRAMVIQEVLKNADIHERR